MQRPGQAGNKLKLRSQTVFSWRDTNAIVERQVAETMMTPVIRTANMSDLEAIKQIAVAAEMFSVEEVEFFDEMFSGWLNGTLEGHQWLVATAEDGSVLGAANYAPEPFADRMWNLYFIAVDPAHQGGGIGRALMADAEAELVAKGDDEARVLVVETSSTDQYSLTREFYAKLGYDEEARIRQFYGPEDAKVVFWKSLIELRTS